VHRSLDGIDDGGEINGSQDTRKRRHAPGKAQGYKAACTPLALDQRRSVPLRDTAHAFDREQDEFACALDSRPPHSRRAVRGYEVDRLTPIEHKRRHWRRQ
jgi:hypothetical protein